MKKVLYVLVALVAIGAVLSLLAPNEFKVERTVSINGPASVIYAIASYFENHDKWAPWNEKDPYLVSSISGEDGKVGAVHSW